MKIFQNVLFVFIFIFVSFFTNAFSFATEEESSFVVPFFLNHDVTIQVPGDKCVFCSHMEVDTIQDALDCLNNVIISPDSTVTIEMTESAKGYDTVEVKHRDGDRINIVGNCSDNKDGVCTIKFNKGQSGFLVVGKSLGLLKNFHLIGNGKEEGASGVLASSTASIQSVMNIIAEGFGFGIISDRSSSIYSASNVIANNNVNGIVSSSVSSIVLNDAIANNNEQVGILSQLNSNAFFIPNSTIEANNNGRYGVLVNVNADALIASTLYAQNNNVSDVALGGGTTIYCSEDSELFIGSHNEPDPSSYVYGCWPTSQDYKGIKTDLIVPIPQN